MIHDLTVSAELLDIARKLSAQPQLYAFRMVGGTAIALQLGHRKSIDIDFFSNEKVQKKHIAESINIMFPKAEWNMTEHSLSSEINGVRVELYDDWHTPFLDEPVVEEGLRLASLKDLAAFKLDAIVERREKKDYIDLYVLFESLGASNVLKEFKSYNPHLSPKSILFALGEVSVARDNKSITPEMLADMSWTEIEKSMISAAREYLKISRKQTLPKKGPRL